MKTNDYEALSALWSDDLDPIEAEELRARIEREPELREAWELMSALPGAISALSDPEPVPEAWIQNTVRLSAKGWRWGHPGWWVAAVALLSHAATWDVPDTQGANLQPSPALADCRPAKTAPQPRLALYGDPSGARTEAIRHRAGVLPPEQRRQPSQVVLDEPLSNIEKTRELQQLFEG